MAALVEKDYKGMRITVESRYQGEYQIILQPLPNHTWQSKRLAKERNRYEAAIKKRLEAGGAFEVGAFLYSDSQVNSRAESRVIPVNSDSSEHISQEAADAVIKTAFETAHNQIISRSKNAEMDSIDVFPHR